MDTFQIVVGVLLLVSALFLIIAVLLQNAKSHNLSGAISGGAETFFGKQKGAAIDKKLSKLTAIVAVIFAVLVLAIYVVQDDYVMANPDKTQTTESSAETATNSDTDVVTDTEAGSET
ncbi:MAG: preprotein translocase subunit SecG [Eubacteriales bacterium]|jgi:preprotein translocase subunit SecG|nr:preprotein translocase subunit SecG [Clostridiales bacterium]